MRVLVIGYGNPGRGDDGLGPALSGRLESLALPGVTVETDYQLSVEHAAMAAEHDVVVFADAAEDCDSPFYLRPITPAGACGFSSHGVNPGEVLFLAGSCFSARPAGYLLGIRAHVLHRFEEALSPAAAEDLEAALDALVSFIRDRTGNP
jgi:hydrogenase maturation protease